MPQHIALCAHLPTSGGIQTTHDLACKLGLDGSQLFSHSPRMWAVPKAKKDELHLFEKKQGERRLAPIVVHTSYLMNLASPDDAIYGKSCAMLKAEIEKAMEIGADAIVTHIGSFRDATLEEGIARVIAALNVWPDPPVDVLLENTAGAGNLIGKSIDELAAIYAGLTEKKQFGFCIDTCHAYASGYEIKSKIGLDAFIAEIDAKLGLANVRAIHLNDCKSLFGSHLDRHEHIGKGTLGADGITNVITHPRLTHLPFILETPYDAIEDLIPDIEFVRKNS